MSYYPCHDGGTFPDCGGEGDTPSSTHGRLFHRLLANDAETWETVVASIVLAVTFGFLAFSHVGPDHIMLTCLACFMVTEIITIKQAIGGFANEGLLTVMVLFAVSQGLTKTGALDWYMGKLLGHPKTIFGAQFRVMVPCALLSAFLNNTPIVVVMIPVIQRWSQSINVSVSQLLMPMSTATILGGTCTLIGTSTNLVVSGLLEAKYPDEVISLFDLTPFGAPCLLLGLAYMVAFGSYLLPGRTGRDTGLNPFDSSGDSKVLLRARLTPWSPAAGRTVQRSGLRDTGGIYLVSVHRALTGNIHPAVSRDFVVHEGDILFFTGQVEQFGEFCDEHGLEMLTSDSPTTPEDHRMIDNDDAPPSVMIGTTKESLLLAGEESRLQAIHRMTDMIHQAGKTAPLYPLADGEQTEAPQVVVSVDAGIIAIAIDTIDRPQLLLDISKALVRLDLDLHHTEAAVVGGRSISVWRCESKKETAPDVEEVWSVLINLLSVETGSAAIKKRGLKVIRARVLNESRLIGKTAGDVDFRHTYKSALLAVKTQFGDPFLPVNTIKFNEGDILILQASDDSPLLVRPPEGFYGSSANKDGGSGLLSLRRNASTPSKTSVGRDEETGVPGTPKGDLMSKDLENVWKDLEALFHSDSFAGREFLTAMVVAPRSQLVGKTAASLTIDRLPGATLVSIERSARHTDGRVTSSRKFLRGTPSNVLSSEKSGAAGGTTQAGYSALTLEEPLEAGDVLWFAGSASALSNVRRVPGLVSYENEVISKLDSSLLDRRMVEAVVSSMSPIVGKTPDEIDFVARYGAVVLAVHRGAKRLHDHPGSVMLQAGDVLLLEAGPSFLAKNSGNDKSFSLLAEVKDSAPPRLSMILPAVLLAVLMIVLYTAEVRELIITALIAAIIMVATGILSEQEARDCLQWDIYVIIASAFGLGEGLKNSGVAAGVANFLVDIGDSLGIGDVGIVGAVSLATMLVSQVLTNNAAAALVFPIAMNVADNTGINRKILSYALMLGASEFMTPYGYTTNLLIYSPGGYVFMDYVRFGGPVQLIVLVIGSLALVTVRPVYISTLYTGVIFAAVCAFKFGYSSFFKSNGGGHQQRVVEDSK